MDSNNFKPYMNSVSLYNQKMKAIINLLINFQYRSPIIV